MIVSPRSFAQWTYFSGSEWNTDLDLWMYFHGSAQIIDGPFHTNGRLNIQLSGPGGEGNPSFLSSVTFSNVEAAHPPAKDAGVGFNNEVAYKKDGYYKGAWPPIDAFLQSNIFKGGLPNKVSAITIPTAGAVLAPIETAANDTGGVEYTGDTTIVFNDAAGAGAMTVTNATEYPTGNHTGTRALPDNNAIYVGGDLNVSGILNPDKRVTVGVDGNIRIVGDLKYTGSRYAGDYLDPTKQNIPIDPGNRMLGLVAGGDVYVRPTTSGISGEPRTIDAYIVAPAGEFKHDSDFNGNYQDRLTVFGGIMQAERGPVRAEGGYTKNYHYDKRMKNSSPSYFDSLTDAGNRIVYAKNLWKGR